MLAIKNSAMKNAFDGIINKLDMANETKKYIKRNPQKSKENRNGRKRSECQGLWDNYKRCNICEMGTTERKEEGNI